MKIIFLIHCLISVLVRASASTEIECNFDDIHYSAVGLIYRCNVNNNPNILTEESAQIIGINGTHDSSRSNNDVVGFDAFDKTIQIFPKGLDKILRNLKLIHIEACQLREIHQSDLKVFPDLIYFFLGGNEVEVIEAGLFDYNPNLEFVGFQESKIIKIDPNVFDNLNGLKSFWFEEVPCIGENIWDSKEQVQEILKVVKSNCSNSDSLLIDEEIKIQKSDQTQDDLISDIHDENLSNDNKVNHVQDDLIKDIELSNDIKIDDIQDDKIPNNKDVILSNDITDKFEDLKTPQCELKTPVDDLNNSQNEAQSILKEVKFLITDQESSIKEIQRSLTQHESNLNQIQSSQNQLKKFQEIVSDSVSKISSELNEFQSSQAQSFNDLYSKINEKKNSQNTFVDDIKSAQTAHNFILNNLSESIEQLSKTLTDLKMDMNLKLESFEDNLKQPKCESDSIKNEFELFRHILSMSMDEKLKLVEDRLMEKMQKITKALYII